MHVLVFLKYKLITKTQKKLSHLIVQRGEFSLSIQSIIKFSIKEYKLSDEIDAFETITVNKCCALACGKSTIESVFMISVSFAMSNNCVTQSLTVY